MDHLLLLHCDVAYDIWIALMCSQICMLVGSPRSVVWKMVPTCLLWCLWRERNDRIFEDRERTFEEIKSLLFKNFVYVDNSLCVSLTISYSNFFLAPFTWVFPFVYFLRT